MHYINAHIIGILFRLLKKSDEILYSRRLHTKNRRLLFTFYSKETFATFILRATKLSSNPPRKESRHFSTWVDLIV